MSSLICTRLQTHASRSGFIQGTIVGHGLLLPSVGRTDYLSKRVPSVPVRGEALS
jgi:hypothetical protein